MDKDNALKSIDNNISSADKTSETSREATSVEENPPETEKVISETTEETEEPKKIEVSDSEPTDEPIEPVESSKPTDPVLERVPTFDPEAPALSTEPKKKSKLLPFLLVILFLLLAAAGACYYIVVYRPDLNPFAKNTTSTAVIPETKPETDTKEAPKLSDSELAALIDAYIEKGNCGDGDIRNLNSENAELWKRQIAWAKIKSNYEEDGFYDENDPTAVLHKYYKNLTYEDLNKAYQNLFGSDENVTKSTEKSPLCWGLSYDDNKNLYYVGTGCGCVDAVSSTYEITNKETDDDTHLIVDIALTESFNESSVGHEFIEQSGLDLPKTTNYRLTFEYDKPLEKYVLKTVKNLN
ncbi:hypothetical protein IKF63_00175 [Candidatus Saccharibacteria bacterium]|nr:hypothetical protein [Candidatus Saccharibacteria bacterium]